MAYAAKDLEATDGGLIKIPIKHGLRHCFAFHPSGHYGISQPMLDTIKSLPDDPAQFEGAGLSNERGDHISHLRKARFDSKSEGLDQLALDLEDDQEIEAAADAQHAKQDAGEEDNGVTAKPPPPKRKHNHTPLPEHLDRQDEVLSAGDACNDCGSSLHQIGEDVTEELESIHGRFVVYRIICPRMACTCCEAFSQAPLPSHPIERVRPGPGLLAHVLVGKYYDHLPLDRQSKIFARENVHLPRSLPMTRRSNCKAS